VENDTILLANAPTSSPNVLAQVPAIAIKFGKVQISILKAPNICDLGLLLYWSNLMKFKEVTTGFEGFKME
jgi:hypothetical protein